MDGRAILMIALSLVAGAAGGLGASYVTKTNSPAMGDGAIDNSALLDELQRLRDSIEGNQGAMLRGASNAAGTSNGARPALDLSAWIDADGKPVGALAKLLEQVESRVGTTMDAKLESWRADEEIKMPSGPRKKKMTLDEVAADLELTADEEAKLRTVLKEVEDEAMKLLADAGQSPDDVRRELKEKGETPEGKAELATKMGMKFVSNMPAFFGLLAKRQTKLRSAIGDKASAFDNGYRVVDPDFVDFDAFDLGN